MSANQTQVPVIQTPDGNITQLQQNNNKVLRNLNNQLIDVTNSVDQLEIIGEIKIASLTLAQFQSQAGTKWVAANGQGCIGTQYSLLTKNNSVPNITVTGANAFIKVN